MTQFGTIILVHGLWMNGMEFSLLRKRLRSAGFRTRLFHYSSRRTDPDTVAERLVRFVASLDTQPISIVAHSLGGLITLRAFAISPDMPVKRVVFLSSPVRGSLVARGLKQRRWGAWLLGRSGDILAETQSPEWHFAPQIGLLVGTRPTGAGRWIVTLEGANDGTVAVAETELLGVTDAATVDAGHMAMVISREAVSQVIHFLHHGQFKQASFPSGSR